MIDWSVFSRRRPGPADAGPRTCRCSRRCRLRLPNRDGTGPKAPCKFSEQPPTTGPGQLGPFRSQGQAASVPVPFQRPGPGARVPIRTPAQPPPGSGCSQAWRGDPDCKRTCCRSPLPSLSAVQRRRNPFPAPHRARAGQRPGESPLLSGGENRQRPGPSPRSPATSLGAVTHPHFNRRFGDLLSSRRRSAGPADVIPHVWRCHCRPERTLSKSVHCLPPVEGRFTSVPGRE